MAGQIIISNIKTDSDNAFSILANTGAVLFSANLASGITTGIADGSVTNAKLAGSITGDKIATGQITGNLIATNAISQNNIVSVNASVASVGTLPTARLPTGSVLQVDNFQTGTLATGSTAIPFDNTIPQITEGDEYMSLAFTPKFSTSKLKIDVVWQGTNASISTNGFVVALFMVGTSNALAANFNSVANGSINNFVFTHYMTSGTTSAITFKVRAGSGNGATTSFNGQTGSALGGGALASSITISEIAA